MEQISNLQELIDWIDNSETCCITKQDSDYFVVEAPNNADWQIQFEEDDDVDVIIAKTIEQLEEFDADERFTELWSREFAEHNHFLPSQFIKMLQEDEETFHNLADELALLGTE